MPGTRSPSSRREAGRSVAHREPPPPHRPRRRGLDDELRESRALIVERLGSCDTIAYPYGQADGRVAAAAARAGYSAACTLTGAHIADGPYLRPRVNMTAADTGVRLSFKVSPLGVGLRRSSAARAVRRLRRRRAWLPASPAAGDAHLDNSAPAG